MVAITNNAISKMYGMAANTDDPSFSPIVQVIHLKQIEATNGEDRYKVRFSYSSIRSQCQLVYDALPTLLIAFAGRIVGWHPPLFRNDRHPTELYD